MPNLKNRCKQELRFAADTITYSLAQFAPRDNKQWAFGCYPDYIFAGNPKYLFLWIALYRPDIRATWITSDERIIRLLRQHGYRVARRKSPEGIKTALRSRVFAFSQIVNSVNFSLSHGAYLLNLWHGVGIKAIRFGRRSGPGKQAKRGATNIWRRLRYLKELQPFDTVVTTSEMMQHHFASQFEQPLKHFPQLGYPRLDCAIDPKLREIAISMDRDLGFDFNADNFNEVYLYAPTWRDTNRSFLDEAIPDLARLSKILSKRDALLYIKPHPQTVTTFSSLPHNIRIWPAIIDCQPYLDTLKALITDYSSILYDYLAVNSNTALLYTFDQDSYLANDRDLLFPFEENTTGYRAFDYDTFCKAIETGVPATGHSDSDRQKLTKKFWGGSRSPASPAIIEYVENALPPG